jgi:hypothetical protein
LLAASFAEVVELCLLVQATVDMKINTHADKETRDIDGAAKWLMIQVSWPVTPMAQRV